MSTTRMRLGALVTAGVLTFGLAACADDDDPETTPTTTVDEAGDATGTATTEDTGGTTEDTGGTTAEGATEEDTATGEAASGETIPVEEFLAMLQEPGEDMLSSYTMTMDVEAEGSEGSLEGAMDLSGDSPRMRMTLVVPEMGHVEVIYADGEAYMSVPGLTPEGMYLLAPSDMLGDAADLEEVDVSVQTELWEEGAREVVFLGEEDVNGEQMRRYQVTVDAQAVMDASTDDAAATSVGLEDEEVVYDVWLDDDNLMRRMAFEVEGETLEMHMDDWGEDQDIQVPEPDQVMDMGELGTGSGG